MAKFQNSYCNMASPVSQIKVRESPTQQCSSLVPRPFFRVSFFEAAVRMRSVHGALSSEDHTAFVSPEISMDMGMNARSRGVVRLNSSENGATNATSGNSLTDVQEKESDRMVEVGKQLSARGEQENSEGVSNTVTLLNPLGLLRDSTADAIEDRRPLLLYVPGMDGTGQGLRTQLCYLVEAGYDIRCVYIPNSERSSWQQLVDLILPLIMEEVQSESGRNRHLTVLGESFGGVLAIRLAKAAPSLVARLIVINPTTNFSSSSPLGSFAAQTGLVALFPGPVYEIAQDIILPLMVKRNRVSTAEYFLSLVDFVPAKCAAWRLSMLNDNSGLSDKDLTSITIPTLLIASGKDRIMSSMSEGSRLQRMLPNSKRVVLPESGHAALLEDSINIANIMVANGFTHPTQSDSFLSSFSNMTPGRPVPKREEAVGDDVMDEMGLIFQPWRVLTSPLISGVENLPTLSFEPRRPILFVGNHTMFGIYDSPILVYELYLRGYRCRGLAHPGHWITGAGAVFERYGHVKATKLAAYRLLKEGENVLLFPGGAREVCKRKGEEYKLLWRETPDFVRMAIRHRAIIIPFGALGGDDAFDILYDTDELKASSIWPVVEQAYKTVGIDPDNAYPVTSFPGTKLPSPFPIPFAIERIYFHFAEPIDTDDYACYINDREQMQTLYEMVKASVECSIELLKDIRSKDPERELPVRLLAKLGRLLPDFLPRKPSMYD